MPIGKNRKPPAWAGVVFALTCCLATGAAQARPIVFGIRLDFGNTQDAQFKSIFDQTAVFLQRKAGFSVRLDYYKTDQMLDAALSQKKPDLVVQMQKPGGHLGYTPFLNYSLYGEPLVSHCLFTQKNSGLSTLASLRNKTLSFRGDVSVYFTLREMTGQAPTNFFSKITAPVSAFSGFYALSLGQVQALYATRLEYLHLRKTNPGSVKNVSLVLCSPTAFPYPPILINPGMDAKNRETLKHIFLTLHQDKTFPMKNFMRLAQIQFRAADPALYRARDNFMQAKEKLGWRRDWPNFQRLMGVPGRK